MSQTKYLKKQIHPRTLEWEDTGIALLTEEDAETLNSSSQFTKIKYVKAPKEKVTKEK